MRIVLAFVAGVLIALLALRVIPPLNKGRKIEARIGRYQLQKGRAVVQGGVEGYETVFLVDTATGRTWELGLSGMTGLSEWHLISARPETAEQ